MLGDCERPDAGALRSLEYRLRSAFTLRQGFPHRWTVLLLRGADYREDWAKLEQLLRLLLPDVENARVAFGYFADEISQLSPLSARVTLEPNTELDWRIWIAPLATMLALQARPASIPNPVMTVEDGWILDLPSAVDLGFLLGESDYRLPLASREA